MPLGVALFTAIEISPEIFLGLNLIILYDPGAVLINN